MQRSLRMNKELQLFELSPPPGISCWMKDGQFNSLEATIIGPQSTPYEGGVFKLNIHIPERYPFEPPQINFITPIYHPNIDNAGRICLDLLKMPPNGGWKPSLNLPTLLTSIQLLMAEPNIEDPLMLEVAEELKYNEMLFTRKAKEFTDLHAKTKH